MKNLWLSFFLFFSYFVSFGQHHSNLDTLWNSLIKSDLCLTGFQYVNTKKSIPKSSEIILNNPKWKSIIRQPKSKLTPFLITKFTDTLKTNLHTCPFFRTHRNELAVYLLQHTYKKNWFNFKDFRRYKNKDITGSTDQPQIWLQTILADKRKRSFLIKSWLKELKSSSEE
jgi:hypothetical protein